jgi:hypothetical protein
MNALSGEMKKEFIFQGWSKSIIRSQVSFQKGLKLLTLRELLKSLGKSLCMLFVMFLMKNEYFIGFDSIAPLKIRNI